MSKSNAYRSAGVDVERKGKFVETIFQMMRRTYDHAVIELPKGFAGLYALDGSKIFDRKYRSPVLAACTDGVGTKLKIAVMADKHDTVGIDLVAMSVNDLVVTGAMPLFFLDYIAVGKVKENALSKVLAGIVRGCKMAGCALLGGETAEMPGFYAEGEYDMAGFAVGIVEKASIVTGEHIRPGDAVIGIASSGLHSNGFSLVRKVVFDQNKFSLDDRPAPLDCPLREELLKPTKIYVESLRSTFRRYRVKKAIKGLAHITGGGFHENIPRVLPRDCAIRIEAGSWTVPPVFRFLMEAGKIPEAEMYHVFNMGIGMVMVVDPFFAKAVVRHLNRIGEEAWIVGSVVKGRREIEISSVHNSVG